MPLPLLLGLRSRSALGRLYTGERLSVREISRLVGSSRSALSRFGIPPNECRRKRTGTLPFGFDYLNHQLVENGVEQTTIRMMRQYRAAGCLCGRSPAISTRSSSRQSRMVSGRPTL